MKPSFEPQATDRNLFEAPAQLRVGVVVIGRNEGPRLAACFNSIIGAQRIVYVDSGSVDDSVAIANHHAVDVIALPSDAPFTAALARNTGAKRLLALDPSLAYIQFIDGDCEMQPGWLLTAQTYLDENPSVAVVCGRRFERYPEQSIYNAMCDHEWNTQVGEAESSGGDSLVRTSAYLNAGGFADDQIAHEEPEFCLRLRALGWRIYRLDVLMTRHDAAIVQLRQFYRRSQRAGLGIMQCLHRSVVADRAGRAIIRRATLWAIILPVLILLALPFDWRFAVGGLALYIVQWLRNCWRSWRVDRWPLRDAVKVSALSLVGKFAEAHGMILFWTRTFTTTSVSSPTYK